MAKSILFVLPFYKGDEGQAVELCRYIAELSGGNKIGEKALVIAAAGANHSRVTAELSRSFSQVQAIQMIAAPFLQPGESGWPKSCNLQFLHTCEYLNQRKDVDAFYYFEPDHVPLTRDWWSRICAEYNLRGRPFMGASFSHNLKDSKSNILQGQHLIGTAIYPRDVWTRIPALQKMETGPDMSVPWDVLIAPQVMAQAHISPLIGNRHASRGYKADRTAVFANSPAETMGRRESGLNDAHVVFHGCKDASLLRVMREKHGFPAMSLSFLHSGDLGDVVYALPGAKAVGGGSFLLTDQRPAREALTPERMASLTPLVAAQPYIKEVKKWAGEWVHFDFTGFRRSLVHHRNLAEAQADWIGADLECVNEKWLTVEPTSHSSGAIINRTTRYHNESFPWISTGGFIGTDTEYADFSSIHGKLTRYQTKDLLEAAGIIAGAMCFYGNQSVCYAIAEGLKVDTYQETYEQDRNCLFARPNARYWFNGKWQTIEKQHVLKVDEMPLQCHVIDGKTIDGRRIKADSVNKKNLTLGDLEPDTQNVRLEPISDAHVIDALVLEIKKFCSSPVATGQVYRILEAHGLRPISSTPKRGKTRKSRKHSKISLTVDC